MEVLMGRVAPIDRWNWMGTEGNMIQLTRHRRIGTMTVQLRWL